MVSALAVVLIVVGVIVALGAALYLLWPMISPHLKQSSVLRTRLTRGTTATKAGGGAELPPLFSPI